MKFDLLDIANEPYRQIKAEKVRRSNMFKRILIEIVLTASIGSLLGWCHWMSASGILFR